MKHSIFKAISGIHSILDKTYDRILMFLYREQFASCGKHVHFYPTRSYFYYKTIEVGSNTYIGPGAMFLATDSSIVIGKKVLFGPNVSIIGGNHSTHIVGKFMMDYKKSDKLDSDDKSVIIENDVWIGSGASILNGVRIGRGAIVAAGAVVVQNVAPYTVVGGVPAKVIKQRWSLEEVLRHEEILYPSNQRLSRETIASIYNNK